MLPGRKSHCAAIAPSGIGHHGSAALRGPCPILDFSMPFAKFSLRLKFPALLALALAFALLGTAARAASFQTLEIVTKTGVQVFSVEMATTEQEKETGLMYRKELADGKGMLFDFSPEQQV